MFTKKTVRDVDVRGKRVLVRVDFNVPLKEGKVSDDTRIKAAIPTLQYLIEKGARVILCSHLGRPKGKIVPEMSLKPVIKPLSDLLGVTVTFAADSCTSATDFPPAAVPRLPETVLSGLLTPF